MSDEQRMMELEIKVAFQDKLIAELDEVVRALRDDVEKLAAELSRLKETLEVDRGPVVDEKPPHH